ncbi:MAG TPA: type II secretion system minor pseudopilin GspI, partial [Gammaproteobacteria bacterium]|nr:type II secretion system minor pseudopilin GspI [Gammaproteobacteria bacterium]
RSSRGFTLLEVMVALAVLAIALAAVIDKTIESGVNVSYLRDRTLAHWVAENKLAEMQAMDEWREGRQTGKTDFAGRTWYWEVEALTTPARQLRRVVIRVSEQEGANPISTLNGFLLNPEVRRPPADGGAPPPSGGEGTS